MASGAIPSQMDERYRHSSRLLLQRSNADLKSIMDRAHRPDVKSLTESTCRLLESARPFSKLHYNKMYLIQPQPMKNVSADESEPTARVGWRLPVWLGAMSRLGSNDKEMQKEALKQVVVGPPKAEKRKRRRVQKHLRLRPNYYQTLAFLSEIGLSDVVMQSLNSDFEESSNNFTSKAYAGYASFSSDVVRSRDDVFEGTGKAKLEISNSHVTLKNMASVHKSLDKTASRNQLRVGGIAALFKYQGNSFGVQSQIPVVNDPKSFLDCSYLWLRPETVLNLEELCRKQGIEPRPHRHMTVDQLLEHYDQQRSATSDDGERVLRIMNRED